MIKKHTICTSPCHWLAIACMLAIMPPCHHSVGILSRGTASSFCFLSSWHNSISWIFQVGERNCYLIAILYLYRHRHRVAWWVKLWSYFTKTNWERTKTLSGSSFESNLHFLSKILSSCQLTVIALASNWHSIYSLYRRVDKMLAFRALTVTIESPGITQRAPCTLKKW